MAKPAAAPAPPEALQIRALGPTGKTRWNRARQQADPSRARQQADHTSLHGTAFPPLDLASANILIRSSRKPQPLLAGAG